MARPLEQTVLVNPLPKAEQALHVKCRFPIRYLSRECGRVSYEDTGEPIELYCLCEPRPIVLCIPAPGDNRFSFRHWVPWLIEAKYRVVTMDLRGMGDSSPRWRQCSSFDVVQDVIDLFNELQLTQERKIIAVAHAESVNAAILLAASKPHWLQALLLVTPYFKMTEPIHSSFPQRPVKLTLKMKANSKLSGRILVSNLWARLNPKKHALLLKRQRYGSGSAPSDVESYLSMLKNQWGEDTRFQTWQRMIRSTYSRQEILSIQSAFDKVACPVFLVCGEFETSTNEMALDYLSELKKQFSNAKLCQIRVLPRCGSVPQEEEPVQLLAMLDNLSVKSQAFWKYNKNNGMTSGHNLQTSKSTDSISSMEEHVDMMMTKHHKIVNRRTIQQEKMIYLSEKMPNRIIPTL